MNPVLGGGLGNKLPLRIDHEEFSFPEVEEAKTSRTH